MDSGPAPSGASPMCNCTSGNDSCVCFPCWPNPSLRAQRSNPATSRMCHGLLRCARNDDAFATDVAFATQTHRRRPAQAKRDAGPITTGRSLRGSHRTASLPTSDTAYGSLLSQGRHRLQYRRQTPHVLVRRAGDRASSTRHSGAMRSIEPGIHNPRPWLWIPGLRPSGASRNDDTGVPSPHRHCERSEAIHLSCGRAMDCFAALAMTLMRSAASTRNVDQWEEFLRAQKAFNIRPPCPLPCWIEPGRGSARSSQARVRNFCGPVRKGRTGSPAPFATGEE